VKVALLVLCYNKSKVLTWSLPIYQAAGFDMFFHLDAKQDLASYKAAANGALDNSFFVGNRVRVFWGGFSMMEAELALIRAARSRGNYDRYVLISDDTFPLLDPARLNSFFDEEVERVALRRLDEDDHFMQRYRKFYFLDHPATSLVGRPIESSDLDAAFFAKIEEIAELRKRGKKDIPIYYGSQWWALTKRAIDHILRTYEEDQHLVQSFRYSAVPDESAFQSLIGGNPAFRAAPAAIHVEWSRNPRPFVFNDEAEFGEAIRPYHAFIRKVADEPAFLEKFQKRLLEGASAPAAPASGTPAPVSQPS
jgi:hypothetical protein